jgi:hypothetical protein
VVVAQKRERLIGVVHGCATFPILLNPGVIPIIQIKGKPEKAMVKGRYYHLPRELQESGGGTI